jgi:2OG-Fe(II) oxygenase superfamily
LLALSINLGKQSYEGGVLEIRRHKSQESVQVVNTEFGDAILFRLADYLEHRVTNVEGTVPKTAFAGWFRSQPDFWASLNLTRQ